MDTRGTPRLYAWSCNPFFGMKVLRSTDLGKSFKETKAAPTFPKDDGRALANIWSLEPGKDKRGAAVRRGAGLALPEPRWGDSWELVPGISKHEHARKWQLGKGGLCMHTILRDGMAMDKPASPARYFGTTTGQLWMGREGGEKWECLFDALPPIHCVKVAAG